MSNFIEEYKKGRDGVNVGLPLGDGLEELTEAIHGVQGGMLYTVASAPKVGKSTLVDYAFLVQTWIAARKFNVPIKHIYYSFEIDRVSKEFDLAAMFLRLDYGITHTALPDGRVIQISANYLRGRMSDKNGNPLPVPDEIFSKLKEVYDRRIVPLFGEYASDGTKLKEGECDIIEEKNNPTGMYHELMQRMESFGRFYRFKSSEHNGRGMSYDKTNSRQMVIVIVDHLRKILPERGFAMKQTIDKFLEYEVELRNMCGMTFVNVIHMNRDMATASNLKLFSDRIYPTPENIKDSGNASEDSDFVLTMFNPNDDRYNLSKFFGHSIRDVRREVMYPDLRSIHLVESRHTNYPKHILVNMDGAQKTFYPFTPRAEENPMQKVLDFSSSLME